MMCGHPVLAANVLIKGAANVVSYAHTCADFLLKIYCDQSGFATRQTSIEVISSQPDCLIYSLPRIELLLGMFFCTAFTHRGKKCCDGVDM
jgi:hypothetical protein